MTVCSIAMNSVDSSNMQEVRRDEYWGGPFINSFVTRSC